MPNKSHDRSPEKQGFSIALPKHMIEELKNISKEEDRSRNSQIERLLREGIDAWNSQHKAAKSSKPAPPHPCGTASNRARKLIGFYPALSRWQTLTHVVITPAI